MKTAFNGKDKKKLVKKLDRELSLYVRMKAANDSGWVQCVTCGAFHIWNDGNMHNGHFITRSKEAVRWDEVNCNPQCASCNSHRQGMHHVYRDRLIEMHGLEAVLNLEHKSRLGGNFCEYQLQEMIDEYRAKNKVLKKEKGL